MVTIICNPSRLLAFLFCMLSYLIQPNTSSAFVVSRSRPIQTSGAFLRREDTSWPERHPRQDLRLAAAVKDMFEYQELRVQLDSMTQQGVSTRRLDPLVRKQLCQYADKIADAAMSNTSFPDDGTWRLVLSNQDVTLQSLPADATIILKLGSSKNTMRYRLEFGAQTLGLNAIQASCTYEWAQQTLCYTYDDITIDAFDCTDVPFGFFGLLQGRVGYIPTAYHDDRVWIERGVEGAGGAYVNVYVKEDDEVRP